MNDKRIHAFTDDDVLGHADATEVAGRIAGGQISAVEAVTAAIERISRVNPVLNAITEPDYERALRQARALRRPRGVFGGVPFAVKDNITVEGLPLVMGSDAMPRQRSRDDGPLCRQLRDTGAIIVGSTKSPEFGWTATTERPGRDDTRNPWHTDYSSGGSSGGSAALVAAGALPFAHANDGGGSIRIPAAACGLVGLKPSRGRLRDDPTTSAMPVPIVANGALARSVRDAARFFTGVESRYRATGLPPIGAVEGPGADRLRVGLVVDSPSAPACDAETRAAVLRTAELMDRLGHKVFEYQPSMPASFRQDFQDYWCVLALGLMVEGKLLFGNDFRPSRLEPLTKGLAARALRRLPRMPLALARLAGSAREYERNFTGVDVFLTPVLTHTTPLIGHLAADLDFRTHFERLSAYAGFTPLHNATGAPAVSLPMARTADGLPIGVMLSAGRGRERLLLELAYELEAAQPFARITQAGS